MGQIRNKSKYALDKFITGKEYLIGSDSKHDGKTQNYEIDDIRNYIMGLSNGETTQVDGISNGDGTYTWLKYGTTITGAGITDVPTIDTLYIGLAYNKPTSVESNDPADYIWGLIDGINYWTDAEGVRHYTWVKYADTPVSGMSDSPLGKNYIGFAFDKTTSEESELYSDYKWSKVTANDGTDGIPVAGTSLYTWVKYGDDINGAGMSDDPAGKLYIGLAYNKDTYIESDSPLAYTWGLIDGTNIDANGKYTWVKYANTPLTGMSDSPTGKAYLGLSFNNESSVESTVYSDYQWSLIRGDAEGDDTGGVATPTDALYTWLKYADDIYGAGMSDDPTDKLYMGLALNKEVSTESYDPTDYVWNLITDVFSYIGADGKTYYIWVKYASDILGNGMSDSPTGKLYIGLAYYKTSATESTDPADYEWSLISSEIQQEPKWLYTWVKFADDSEGHGMSDYPDGKIYMGLAYNKDTSVESIDPTDYVWNLINGDQGYVGIDGKTYYTWIKYAATPTSTELFDSPENLGWMGMAFNKETPTESTNYADYTWYPLAHKEVVEGVAFNQNNLVREINIPQGTLAEVTADTIASYLNSINFQCSEFENLVISVGDTGVIASGLDYGLSIELSVDGSPTETTANLVWDINGDEGLIRYEVFITPVNGAPYHKTSNTSLNLTGLVNGTSYYAYVKGFDVYDNWKVSNTVQFNTKTTFIDANPVLYLVELGRENIEVRWAIDSGFGATNYKLYIIGGVNEYVANTLVYQGLNTSFDITGLDQDTEYSIYVEAHRGTEDVNTSNTLTQTTTFILDTPVISFVNLGEDSYTFSISRLLSDPVDGYDVFYAIDSPTPIWAKKHISNNGLTQTLGGLTPDRNYLIKIQSTAGIINSLDSNTLSFTTASNIKAAISLEKVNIPTVRYSGHQKQRYTSATWTSPNFPLTPIKAGTKLTIMVHFHANGNIEYSADYLESFTASQDYANVRDFYNAEVVSLGAWGDIYTSASGFNAEGTSFQVTSHRDGTASRDVTTDVYFEFSSGALLKVFNGKANGTADILLEASGFSGTGIYTGITDKVNFSKLNLVVTPSQPKTVVVTLDALGNYTDSFAVVPVNWAHNVTVKGTLLKATSGIDVTKTTSSITYNY